MTDKKLDNLKNEILYRVHELDNENRRDIYDINNNITFIKSSTESVVTNLENKVEELESKLEVLTEKYLALLKICEKNFPSEVSLYFEIYGKNE